ncbi:hypothetical protein B0T19DRAFT_270819 [Cercophora scortea]|uniref:Uncharacterized protein n=1 Tax=Cercophora scortea TaxID=314031 RepID=A0AAE0M531_9PEZI|nr:hypothetical protein B0T19DRAFT_270819 [Cercophora scortea]
MEKAPPCFPCVSGVPHLEPPFEEVELGLRPTSFPDWTSRLPQLRSPADRTGLPSSLALTYTDRLGPAALNGGLFRNQLQIRRRFPGKKPHLRGVGNWSTDNRAFRCQYLLTLSIYRWFVIRLPRGPFPAVRCDINALPQRPGIRYKCDTRLRSTKACPAFIRSLGLSAPRCCRTLLFPALLVLFMPDAMLVIPFPPPASTNMIR